MSSTAPIVSIQFTFDDENITDKKHTIIKELTSTHPYELNKISEDAATSNESFKYSGRHDHGPNAKLKEGGYYASMITALVEAKELSNEILTGEMETQKLKEEGGGQKKKKPRVNEADAYE